jgi:hypothetical protein
MGPTVHELDSNGDLVLILQNPDALFAQDEVEDSAAPSNTDRFRPLSRDLEFGRWAVPQSKRVEQGISSFRSLDPGKDPERGYEDRTAFVPEPFPADETLMENEPSLLNRSAPEDRPLSTMPEDEADSRSIDAITDDDQRVEVRMHLSSKHLILASTYFRKCLKGLGKKALLRLTHAEL